MTDDRAKAYSEAVAAVRVVVNRVDPMGLIAMGASEDEYDPEVTDLVRLVMAPASFGPDEVDAIWTRWFGDSYTRVDNTRSLAEQTVKRPGFRDCSGYWVTGSRAGLI